MGRGSAGPFRRREGLDDVVPVRGDDHILALELFLELERFDRQLLLVEACSTAATSVGGFQGREQNRESRQYVFSVVFGRVDREADVVSLHDVVEEVLDGCFDFDEVVLYVDRLLQSRRDRADESFLQSAERTLFSLEKSCFAVRCSPCE